LAKSGHESNHLLGYRNATVQEKLAELKPRYRRAKRIAFMLSSVVISWIVFLLYEYDGDAYQHFSFWRIRGPVFAAIFMIAFAVLWLRSRRGKPAESPKE
jgi:hypothetical protein